MIISPLSPHGLQPTSLFPPFIPECTGIGTAQLQSASIRLSSLPPSDIQVWIDRSVPSLFGPGGDGVYVKCSKCNTSNSLSFSSGPIASSFTAETFALKQGLDWCTSLLMTCNFRAVLFLTDSQSALSIIASAPFYLSSLSSGMFGPSPPLSPTTPL